MKIGGEDSHTLYLCLCVALVYMEIRTGWDLGRQKMEA
jgi:hypothetical protein